MKGKHLLLIGISLGAVLLGMLLLFYGYDNTWRLWNIPTMSPYFADVRTITGGSESYAMGYDPLVNNPRDPWGRAMNYPRIWQVLYSAGIDQSHTIYFGIAFALFFTVSIFLYTPSAIDHITAIVLIVLVFSPAVLLGVERGNNDLFIFFLLSIAIVLLNTRSTLPKTMAIATILLASALKLFPIFSFAIVIREKKITLIKLVLSVLTVVSIYSILTYDDLILIRQGTPKSTGLSYGINVFWMRLNEYSSILGGITRIITYIAGMTGFIVLYVGLREKKCNAFVNDRNSQKRIDAFRIGSGIYIGTFLLGNNWDYRLVFLLFTIPQLVFWAKSYSNYISLIAKVVIISVLVSMWYLVIRQVLTFMLLGSSGVSFVLDEIANWIMFFGLTYLISFSVPEWLKDSIINVCSPTRRCT